MKKFEPEDLYIFLSNGHTKKEASEHFGLSPELIQILFEDIDFEIEPPKIPEPRDCSNPRCKGKTKGLNRQLCYNCFKHR